MPYSKQAQRVGAVLCLACAYAAVTHNGFAHNAVAQTVQLPTQSVFGVQTTVSVPDRGRALLGGVDSSTTRSDSRGVPLFSHLPGVGPLFSNRDFSRSTTASRAYATAQIIDHRELDRAVLSAARQRNAAGQSRRDTDVASVASQLQRRAAFLNANIGRPHARTANRRGTSPGPATYRPSRSQTVRAARQASQSEAGRFLEQGRAALERGRSGAAKVYFQMALRRSHGETAHEARHALAQLDAPPLDAPPLDAPPQRDASIPLRLSRGAADPHVE